MNVTVVSKQPDTHRTTAPQTRCSRRVSCSTVPKHPGPRVLGQPWPLLVPALSMICLTHSHTLERAACGARGGWDGMRVLCSHRGWYNTVWYGRLRRVANGQGRGKGRIGIGKIWDVFVVVGWRRVNPRSLLGFHMLIPNATQYVPCKSRSLTAPRRALFTSENASPTDAIYSVYLQTRT